MDAHSITVSDEDAARRRAILLRAADGLMGRAESALRAGDLFRAERLTRRVLRSESKHLGALELLAKTLLRQGDSEGTLQIAAKLLAINPYDPGYHSLRGLAMHAQGRYAEASLALGKDPAASLALQGLRREQQVLVKEMLRTDPEFARHYAVSPTRTLRERGFAVN